MSHASVFRSVGAFIGSGFFFFKQKTAYELRISDWSSDVCSSDLQFQIRVLDQGPQRPRTDIAGGPLHDATRSAGGLRRHAPSPTSRREIGRASCRESVCQYV